MRFKKKKKTFLAQTKSKFWHKPNQIFQYYFFFLSYDHFIKFERIYVVQPAFTARMNAGMVCACMDLYDCPHCKHNEEYLISSFNVVVGSGRNSSVCMSCDMNRAHFKPLISTWSDKGLQPPCTLLLDPIQCSGCNNPFDPPAGYKGRKPLCTECRDLQKIVREIKENIKQ